MMSFNPPTMPRPVVDVYAQISVAPPGRVAFIAGQAAVDLDGRFVGIGDHHAQAVQCFRNRKAAIEALEAAPSQLVRLTINVVDHRDELLEPIITAGREVFGDQWPVCVSIFLGVQALGHSDWLIEIDGVVALGA